MHIPSHGIILLIALSPLPAATPAIAATDQGTAIDTTASPSGSQLAEAAAKAHKGDAEAGGTPGERSDRGLGYTAAPQQALRCDITAAERGHADDMLKAGLNYLESDHSEAPARAVACFRAGADLSNGRCLYMLANCYADGLGVPQSDVLYFAYMQEAAEHYCADAYVALGECYELAIGTDENPERAVLWYSRGAETGDAEALFNLALCLECGYGTEESAEQAFSLMQLAAEAGHVPAIRVLGVYYEQGIGTAVNAQQAIDCYHRAAEAGDTQSLLRLGLCHASGIGNIPAQEAFRYISLAATHQLPEAFICLSLMYRDGVGTPADSAKAEEALREAIRLTDEDYVADYLRELESHPGE